MAIRVWLASRATNVTIQDVQQRELDNTGIVIIDRAMDATWHVRSWDGLPVGPVASEPWGDGPADQPL